MSGFARPPLPLVIDGSTASDGSCIAPAFETNFLVLHVSLPVSVESSKQNASKTATAPWAAWRRFTKLSISAAPATGTTWNGFSIRANWSPVNAKI